MWYVAAIDGMGDVVFQSDAKDVETILREDIVYVRKMSFIRTQKDESTGGSVIQLVPYSMQYLKAQGMDLLDGATQALRTSIIMMLSRPGQPLATEAERAWSAAQNPAPVRQVTKDVPGVPDDTPIIDPGDEDQLIVDEQLKEIKKMVDGRNKKEDANAKNETATPAS